jgi:acetylornithine deacetylase/succinyl-diaminopimelate desuccinylase-like protein
LWLDIETAGRSCHAAIPDQGINAISAMARVVQFIHGPWTGHIQHTEHPLLGRSTMQVTTIEGGSRVNIIPARCRCQVDGRFIPGKTTVEIVAELQQMLADHLGPATPLKISNVKGFGPLDTPLDTPLVVKLMALCRQASGQTAPIGVNYFADTGPFTEAGITSVLFGAGDIAQAHTADEFLELDQLFLAAEIMLTLLTENAGRSVVDSA